MLERSLYGLLVAKSARLRSSGRWSEPEPNCLASTQSGSGDSIQQLISPDSIPKGGNLWCRVSPGHLLGNVFPGGTGTVGLRTQQLEGDRVGGKQFVLKDTNRPLEPPSRRLRHRFWDLRDRHLSPKEITKTATCRFRLRPGPVNPLDQRKGRVVSDSALLNSYPGGVGYIIPPMPPMPPSMPPPGIEAGSGLSATMASVVKRSAAMEAAF